MRAIHKKYGIGYIIEDIEGSCNSDEVVFKPDNGCPNVTSMGRDFFTTASFDIVYEKDLEYLKDKK